MLNLAALIMILCPEGKIVLQTLLHLFVCFLSHPSVGVATSKRCWWY